MLFKNIAKEAMKEHEWSAECKGALIHDDRAKTTRGSAAGHIERCEED